MNDYNKKRELFLEELVISKMENIFKEVIDEPESSSYFITKQQLGGGYCTLVYHLDDTHYNVIQYHFLKLEDTNNKEAVLNLFNELNEKYKSLKFFIDKHNNLIAQNTYISSASDFSPEMFLDISYTDFSSISDTEYPQIMRAFWS